MKVYIDIDETILVNNIENGVFVHKPANYLKEFLKNIIENHDVYWLTTHCNGDAAVPVAYLSRHFDDELVKLIMKIKPTKWSSLKIEAIDLTESFMWFDDVLFQTEEKMLSEAGKLDSYVKVDLDKNMDFFKDYLKV